MARKPRSSRDVGRELAASNERDRGSGNGSPDSEAPSRTQRKNESEELQKVGERLLQLRMESIAELSLPEKLEDALRDAKRLTNFGAKRRQLQFIGKLMRQLDRQTLDAVEAALRRLRPGSVQGR
jgi:ribosome-associated protein